MTVRLTMDPAAFQKLVFPYLQRDPVLNSTILTNVADRVRGIMNDPAPPIFFSVHDAAGEVNAAGFCTALRGVNLMNVSAGLVPPLAEALAEAAPRAIAAIGPVESAHSFAELYSGHTGRRFRQSGRMRQYRLEEFVEQRTEGAPRLATEADLEVLAPMFSAYRGDLGHPDESTAADRQWVQQRIERDRLWVWVDGGRIVTMVGHQSPMFGSVRVGPVYTPPSTCRGFEPPAVGVNK
jgi:hypothetical protein